MEFGKLSEALLSKSYTVALLYLSATAAKKSRKQTWLKKKKAGGWGRTRAGVGGGREAPLRLREDSASSVAVSEPRAPSHRAQVLPARTGVSRGGTVHGVQRRESSKPAWRRRVSYGLRSRVELGSGSHQARAP